jgi:hypothetical protein
MARTDLPVQQINRIGLNPAYTAGNGSGGHSISNDGRVFFHVKNGGGAPITATAQTPVTVDDLAVADRVVTVPAGGERMIGPFPPGLYNQSDGKVYLDFSDVTSVTVGAFRL